MDAVRPSVSQSASDGWMDAFHLRWQIKIIAVGRVSVSVFNKLCVPKVKIL